MDPTTSPIRTTSRSFILVVAITASSTGSCAEAQGGFILQPEAFQHYVDRFNRDDEELYVQHIPNERAWPFFQASIPLFERPDRDVERTYYFRWRTYRKYIKQTPDGFVVTEFLPPVGWAGKHNTINCATGTLPSSARTEGASAGWCKYEGNPVLGGRLGTCFDVTLLQDNGTYRMWFSWRPKDSVALVESRDGIHWSEPQIVLGPKPGSEWEARINRPAVVKHDGVYHMWHTGQSAKRSWLGYATSPDGRTWTRASAQPVLSAEQRWEGVAVMCPHVLWDDKAKQYRMWYSAGEQYEPNAIGYAASTDGIHWTKHQDNPIFAADPRNPWEQHKVTACQVIPAGDWHLMFYIGFHDENRAQIGLARSRDGITGWQRHPANPILFPTPGTWDADACYKPFAIFDSASNRWLVWYNGRKGGVEQIGLATHPGYDLGFPAR